MQFDPQVPIADLIAELILAPGILPVSRRIGDYR
jgi:hypothetical protein